MPKSCPCTKIDGFWKDKPNHLVHSVSNLSESFSCSKTIVKDSYSLYFIALFFPTLILDSLISKKFMSVCVCVFWVYVNAKLNEVENTSFMSVMWWIIWLMALPGGWWWPWVSVQGNSGICGMGGNLKCYQWASRNNILS